MDLKAELKKMNEEFAATAPPEAQQLFGRVVQSLRKSAIVTKGPKKGDRIKNFGLNNIYLSGAGREVGERIQNFVLKDYTGNEVSLSSLLEHGPVVLNFYRGSWCPYCNLELRALQSQLNRFQEKGAVLVAISPEKPDESIKTMQNLDLDFIVLSDPGAKVAKSFRLVYQQPIQETMFAGVDIAAHNGDDEARFVIPATYVIDQDYTVRFAFADEDFTNRVDPEELVTLLDVMQSEVRN